MKLLFGIILHIHVLFSARNDAKNSCMAKLGPGLQHRGRSHRCCCHQNNYRDDRRNPLQRLRLGSPSRSSSIHQVQTKCRPTEAPRRPLPIHGAVERRGPSKGSLENKVRTNALFVQNDAKAGGRTTVSAVPAELSRRTLFQKPKRTRKLKRIFPTGSSSACPHTTDNEATARISPEGTAASSTFTSVNEEADDIWDAALTAMRAIQCICVRQFETTGISKCMILQRELVCFYVSHHYSR